MEINSPNWQEMHWIREILRQGMVVARQATATYIEVVVQLFHIYIFSIWYAVFHLSKNRTENRFPVPVRAVNRVPVHKTTNNQ